MSMQCPRPSPLITGIGIAHIVYGLLFLGVAGWVLAAGGDAVSRVLLAGQAAKGAATNAPGLIGEQANQVSDIAGKASKGLASVFVATATAAAGCLIVQGLPLVTIGIGVLGRRRLARSLAILLAVLPLVQGGGLLLAPAAAAPTRIGGVVLLTFAVVTLYGLMTKQARWEFSGLPQAQPQDEGPVIAAEERAPRAVPVGWVVGGTMLGTAAVVVGVIFLSGWRPFSSPKPGADGTERAPPVAELSPQERLTAFHQAVDKGQVSRSLDLLRAGVHPDDRDEQGTTALMRTSAQGQVRLTALLLGLGANANERDRKGRTPLMLAAGAGHGPIAQLLLGRVDALGELINAFQGVSDVEGPDWSVPLDLKELGKFDKLDFKDLEKLGRTPPRAAPGKLRRVARPSHADVNARDDDGKTALMLAAAAGHGDVAKLLLTAGADREVTDHDGMPAWGLAAVAGHEEVMKALLPAVPDRTYLNRKNRRGKTAFELAAAQGHTRVIDVLRPMLGDLIKEVVVAPPPMKPITGTAGSSPLFVAVKAGQLDTVKKLLDGDAALDGRDEQGRTALMLAASRGDAMMVVLLGNHLGNSKPELFDAVDVEGHTALMHAAAAGKGEAVDALLVVLTGIFSRGKVNWARHLQHKDKKGQTAQALAKAGKHPACADAIEKYWKDSLDKRGTGTEMTALEMASEAGDLATVEALLRSN